MKKEMPTSAAGLSPAQAVYDERCRLPPTGTRDLTLGIYAFFVWVWVVNALEEAYQAGLHDGRIYEVWAEVESATTCEECGAAGATMHERCGWLETLCNKCTRTS